MRFIFYILILILTAGAHSAWAELTANELNELKNFSLNANFYKTGTLISPPVGNVQPEIAKQKKQIYELIEELAGPRLRAEGRRIFVGIYSSREPIVTTQKFNENSFAEKAWQKSNPGIIWPIRKWLGFEQNGQPFFSINFTVGALNATHTRSQLAFLVARELAHIFENHHEYMSIGDNFGSQQKIESIADQIAITMMVGKYNLDDVLPILEYLLTQKNKKSPPNDPHAALKGFLDDEQHEGVRVALAQHRIEYIKRSDANARVMPLAHLNFRRYLGSRSETERNRYGRFSNEIENQKQIIFDQFIKQDSFESIVKYSQNTDSDDLSDNLAAKWGLIRPTEYEINAILPWFLTELQKQPNLKAQDRIDRFFSWWVANQLMGTDVKTLSTQSQSAFTKFIFAQTKSGDQWDPLITEQRFLKQDGDHTSPNEYLHTIFSSDLFGLEAANQLTQLSPIWPTYAEKFVRIWNTNSDNTNLSARRVILNYADLVDRLNNSNNSTIQFAIWNRTLLNAYEALLLSDDFSLIINEIEQNLSAPYFDLVDVIFKTRKKYQFDDKIDALLSSYVDRFSAMRVKYVKSLKPNKLDTAAYGVLANDIFDSHKYIPFKEAELEEIAPILARIANSFIEGPGALPNQFADESSYAIWGFSTVLTATNVSREQKMKTLKFMASEKFASSDLKETPVKAETVSHLQKFMSRMTTAELLEVLKYSPPQFQKDIELIINDPALIAKRAEHNKVMQKFSDLAAAGNVTEAQALISTHRMFDFEDSLKMMTARDLESKTENSILSVLTFAGISSDFRNTFTKQLTFKELQEILRIVYKARKDSKRTQELWPEFNTTDDIPTKLSPNAGALLFETLLHCGTDTDLIAWVFWFERIYRLAASSLDMRPEVRDALEAQFIYKLKSQKPSTILHYLKKPYIQDLVSSQNTAHLLIQYFDSTLTPEMTDAQRAQLVSGTVQKINLRSQSPDSYEEFRTQMTDHLKLQPDNIDDYFAESTASMTEQTNGYAAEVRGLSALVALARPRPVQEQMHLIDYLMSRRADRPDFLTEKATDIDPIYPVTAIVRLLRERLASASVYERTFITDTFLAGPSSVIYRKDDLQIILDKLLKPVKPENRELAYQLAHAMIDSHDKNASLALAYVFAQKNKDGGELTEEDILKGIFEAYGVAGIKLGQYLGFTGELKDYSDILSVLQDSAMPLNYYQVLQLINKRFGNKWPKNLTIKTTMGSGSVNVAILYQDENKIKREEVVSILRSDIEIATQEDFKRLQKLVAALTKKPEDKKKFGYLSGLLKIIKASVELEFNKHNAYQIQNFVNEFYARQAGPWRIQTLSAYKQEFGSLFMQKGLGRTARKVFKDNPAHYKEALGLLAQIELEGLFGVDQRGNIRPVPFIANPDFHDGQVLINEETKNITILDFGQALFITNSEREMAIEILRVITKAESPSKSVQILNRLAGREVFSVSDINTLFRRDDRMDIFVQLISQLSLNGFDVPLSPVHWILALNRQIVLGDKIGKPILGEIKKLLFLRKVGAGLGTLNFSRLAVKRLKAIFKPSELQILPCAAVLAESP